VRRVVAGGGGFEDGAVDGVGEEAAPGAVGGDPARHVGRDGSVAGEFGGVVVETEQGRVRDDDLDVGAAFVLVGQPAAKPVQPVAQHVFEQVGHRIGAPLIHIPPILGPFWVRVVIRR